MTAILTYSLLFAVLLGVVVGVADNQKGITVADDNNLITAFFSVAVTTDSLPVDSYDQEITPGQDIESDNQGSIDQPGNGLSFNDSDASATTEEVLGEDADGSNESITTKEPSDEDADENQDETIPPHVGGGARRAIRFTDIWFQNCVKTVEELTNEVKECVSVESYRPIFEKAAEKNDLKLADARADSYVYLTYPIVVGKFPLEITKICTMLSSIPKYF